MSDADLETLRKRTRWVYYADGVAYGPFSVDEILGLVDDGTLDGASELMELGTTRRVPLGSVRWFRDRFNDVCERQTREREEREFENTRQRLGRSRGAQFYLVNIVLPLVLVLLLAAGIFWKQLLGLAGGEDPGEIHVTDPGGEDPSGASGPAAGGPAKPAEPEFVEAEAGLEAGLEDYALGLTVEADDTTRLKGVDAGLGPRSAKRLPKVLEVRRPSPRKAVATANDAGGARTAEEAVVELDFSDEAPDDAEDPGENATVEDTVRRRLQPVLKECALAADGPPPDLLARVAVRPTGSLGSLRLTVDPPDGAADIRMCVLAGMAGIRLPAFDGPEVLVETTN